MGEVIKKNWVVWVVTFFIAISAPLIVLSKSTSYQESLREQELLIRLDKEKEDRGASLERDKALEIKINNTEDKLSKAIEKLGDKMDQKTDEQTKQIIDIIKKIK
jgi:hypothetical protein